MSYFWTVESDNLGWDWGVWSFSRNIQGIPYMLKFENCWLRAWDWLGHHYLYIMIWAKFFPVVHLYNEILYSPQLNWFYKTSFIYQTWTFRHQLVKYIKSYCMVELPPSWPFCFSRVNLSAFTAWLVYLWQHYCFFPLCCKKECKTRRLKGNDSQWDIMHMRKKRLLQLY